MADEITGGLPTVEDTTVPALKSTQPRPISVAGQKGVSLEPEQSMEVRNRLLEMIRRREAERSGFGAMLENLAVYGQDPTSSLDQRMANYGERKRQREQDIFNMQLGVSQLDTEEKRLAQARAEQLQNRQQFGSLLSGGVGGAPGGEQGGQIASPQQVVSFAQNLNKDQAAALMMLYKQNPAEATKQLIQLTKLTDSQREAREAGLTPGSPDYQAFMRLKLAGSGAFVPHKLATEEGMMERTPIEAARPSGALSETPGPAPVTTPPIAPPIAPATGPLPGPAPTIAPTAVPAPAPTAGPLPSPAPTAGPLPGPAPTVRPTTGALPGPAPATVMPPVAAVPPAAVNTRPGGFNPKSAEALDLRKKQVEANIEFEKQRKLKEEESKIALEQKRQEVPISGATKEAEKVGETSAADQAVHSTNVKMAPTNALIANQLEKDINAVPGLLGKLNKPTIFSTIMNLADKGVQVGNLGSISIPGLKDAIVQLDPEVRKDPKKLEAYQRVVNNISKIGLEFARAVNQGMGSMSNYERNIVERAVGDPSSMSANNLMIKAKALECDAKNAMEKDKLWSQMQKAGYDWAKFKKSPEYIDMERKQFYRTAKAMHLPDAKFPGDQ